MERTFTITLFFLSMFLSFFLSLHGIFSVGPTQDSEYFEKKNIVVGYSERQRILIFNEFENYPNSSVEKEFLGIRFISQSLPPVYRIGEKGYIVSAWYQTGPIPDIFQNIILSFFGYSITSIRISHIITVIFSFLSIFLICKALKDFLSFAFIVTSSIFFYFSAFSFAGGRYYLWSFILINFAFYFILRFLEDFKLRNFFLSAIFCGLATASYSRAGIFFSFIFALLVFIKTNQLKRKVVLSLIYFVINLFFFLPTFAFWLIFYDLDLYFPRPWDRTFMRIFPRTGLKFAEALTSELDILKSLKVMLKDILFSFNFYFMGNDIWIDFSYHFDFEKSFIPSAVFFLSGLFAKRKLFFAISLIYIALESITFKLEGFPRRVFFVFPFFAFSISSFLWEIKSRSKIGYLFFLFFPLYFLFFQTKHNLYVLENLNHRGYWYEFSHINLQKEIVNFLLENKIEKIENIGAPLNIHLMSYGRIIQYDWSYVFFFLKKDKEVFEAFFKYIKNGNEDVCVLTSWLLPFEEVLTWANHYGLKLEKIKDFTKSGKILFTLFCIRR